MGSGKGSPQRVGRHDMARVSWLDQDNLPIIDDHVKQLEHFTQSLADGVIDKNELDKQQQAVVVAMKAVEGDLHDELHAKVTTLLVELTAPQHHECFARAGRRARQTGLCRRLSAVEW